MPSGMATLVLNPKAPSETARYAIPWNEIYPDTIVSFTLTVSSGTVVIGDTDFDPRTVYALISGGVDGETATLAHTITTTAGQVLPLTITLKVGLGDDVLDPRTSYTKGDLVIQALGQISIANYVFDTEAEEDQAALRLLDDMLADWQDGLEPLGYNFPDSAGGSLPSDDCGLSKSIIGAVVANLAVQLAPSYGKTPSPFLLRRSAMGRSNVFTKYRIDVEVQMNPRTPLGAGNRYWGTWRRNFFPTRP
jgi:hypothetical protein